MNLNTEEILRLASAMLRDGAGMSTAEMLRKAAAMQRSAPRQPFDLELTKQPDGSYK